MRRREFDDLVFVHAEHDSPHDGRHRVVQMHDGARCALECFESSRNEVVTRLGEHLNRNVVGYAVFFDQFAHEIELDLRR